MTNTLAYYSKLLIDLVKSFIVSTPKDLIGAVFIFGALNRLEWHFFSSTSTCFRQNKLDCLSPASVLSKARVPQSSSRLLVLRAYIRLAWKLCVLRVMSELVKFLSLSNLLELCSDHFPDSFDSNGVSIRVLLFGQMELDYPLCMFFKMIRIWQTQKFDQLISYGKKKNTLAYFTISSRMHENVFNIDSNCYKSILFYWLTETI